MITQITCLNSPTIYGVRRNSHNSGVQFSACIYLLLLSIVDIISIMPVPLLAVDVYMNQWQFGILLCKLVYTFEGTLRIL